MDDLYISIKEAPETTFDACIKRATDGLFLEFGVHTGGTIGIIASNTPHKVYGFDSFDGLPEAWNNLPEGTFRCTLPEVPDNVELVVGMFQDTLKPFLKKHKEKIAFIHIDCDLYSSTKYIFDCIKHRLADDCIICFDELIDYGDNLWLDHEYKAFNEFLENSKFKAECIGRYGPHRVAFRLYKE